MNFIRLYGRVLVMLGPEARLGWILAVANLALAGALFAEPILFGRIIDTLTASQSNASGLDWNRLILLLGAWVGFALVHHRRRNADRAARRPAFASPVSGGARRFSSSTSCNCRSAITPARIPAG